MNIIDAAKQLKWTDVLISDEGFVAKMDEGGMICNFDSEEAFGFYPSELFSDGWKIMDEEDWKKGREIPL
jgi:hypothetical protein